MTEAIRANVAETVRDLMLDIGDATEVANGDDPLAKPHLVSLPANRKIEDLTRYHREALEYLRPARRKGTARLASLDSLVDWANRFKGETSALYADPDMEKPSLTCIADYHAGGAAVTDTSDPAARHCHHRAVYDFPLSDEWRAWTGISGVPLGKDEFGEFIEANAKDIMDPTPAILAGKVSEMNEAWENRLIETAQRIEGRYGQLTQLLSMSKRFQVYETSDLSLVSNRDTGEVQLQFMSEHKTPDGKPISVPNLIMIAIPVFRYGAAYRMPVRFRYRKTGAEVKFILSVYGPERAFQAAFDEALDTAIVRTDLPLFQGKPEI